MKIYYKLLKIYGTHFLTIILHNYYIYIQSVVKHKKGQIFGLARKEPLRF